MQSPSAPDCLDSIKRAEKWIESDKTRIDDFEANISRQRDRNNVEAIERLCRLRDLSASSICTREELINMANQNRVMGSVKAVASGRRTHENGQFNNNLAMDIALIDVTELDIMPEYCRCLGDWSLSGDPADLFGSWETVNLSRRIASAEDVVKFGRTTGVTQGYLHPIQANVNFTVGEHSHRSVSACVVHPRRVRSSIRNFPSMEYEERLETFIAPGDSGAFVLTKAYDQNPVSGHRVIGLLFGESTNSGLAYFIPFDAVIKEIEALTGGKVIWPVKRD